MIQLPYLLVFMIYLTVPSVARIVSNWIVRLLGSNKFKTTLNVAAVTSLKNYSGIYETGQKKSAKNCSEYSLPLGRGCQ